MVDKVKTKALEDNAVDESKLRLTNDAFLKARNNADNADINMVKVNATDGIEFASLPLGPNADAPTVDAELANKKYVDDEISNLSGALVYRGSLAAPADITGNATGNAYLDGTDGLVQGDYFKISAAGLITTSDGTIAVDIGDALIANKNVGSDITIVNADLDKIDNTEASDILRQGDLSATQMFVGNSSNEAQARTISGDIAVDNAGVTTIQANAVTTSKVNNGAITEAKLNADVDSESLLIAAGYDSSGASGDVAAAQTMHEAIRRVEKKADDALAGAGADPEREVLSLDATDINVNKYKDLAFEARDGVLMSIRDSSGAGIRVAVDYSTSVVSLKTRITWSALGLDGHLEIGDILEVSYIKA